MSNPFAWSPGPIDRYERLKRAEAEIRASQEQQMKYKNGETSQRPSTETDSKSKQK